MANPEDKIGALWLKSSSRGDYFSGEIEIDGVKHRIVAFRNTFKNNDKQPDYAIFKSQPRGER